MLVKEKVGVWKGVYVAASALAYRTVMHVNVALAQGRGTRGQPDVVNRRTLDCRPLEP